MAYNAWEGSLVLKFALGVSKAWRVDLGSCVFLIFWSLGPSRVGDVLGFVYRLLLGFLMGAVF